MRTEDEDFSQVLTYKKADSLMTLGQLQARKENGPTALLDYSGYGQVSGRKLSTNRIVRIQNGVKNYILEMNFVDSEFDKQLEYPFSMPKNFAVKNQ